MQGITIVFLLSTAVAHSGVIHHALYSKSNCRFSLLVHVLFETYSTFIQLQNTLQLLLAEMTWNKSMQWFLQDAQLCSRFTRHMPSLAAERNYGISSETTNVLGQINL